MIEENFSIGISPLHRLDPRLKVALATAFAFVVALSEQFSVLSAALLVSAVLLGITRIGWGAVLKRLMIVNGFVLFFWVILPLTVPGRPLLEIGPLVLTREGTALAAKITLKSNAILMGLIGLVATSSIATIGHALNRFRVPDKLVHLLLLTYRYVFVLDQEYDRLHRAIRARGFVPRTGLHTYRTYAYLIGMLFVRAAARADRVHQAMLCRGFKGKFYSLQLFSFAARDAAWGIVLGGVILGLGVLEWIA
jgi:cobalt/nickel transport system permease protein